MTLNNLFLHHVTTSRDVVVGGGIVADAVFFCMPHVANVVAIAVCCSGFLVSLLLLLLLLFNAVFVCWIFFILVFGLVWLTDLAWLGLVCLTLATFRLGSAWLH